jgi:hypothetical protein
MPKGEEESIPLLRAVGSTGQLNASGNIHQIARLKRLKNTYSVEKLFFYKSG